VNLEGTRKELATLASPNTCVFEHELSCLHHGSLLAKIAEIEEKVGNTKFVTINSLKSVLTTPEWRELGNPDSKLHKLISSSLFADAS